QENCLPFIDIAKRLQESGANVPKIVASNLEHGFLVLTDLGEQVYLPALAHQEQVEHLYQDALDALLLMQTHTATHNLPLYDHQLLHNEMDLFTHWLWGKHLNFPSPPDTVKPCFELLSHSALSQPQVFVHRDYHSRNLMCLPQNNPGILDFQDAVLGPITYDLVSLLRDCYISWPLKQVQGWALDYYAHAQHANLLKGIDQKQFLQWFDWMGIQRHLKASGIFARLYHRDGKSGYLKDIPRTLNYIVEVTAHYPELTPLHQVVKTTLNHLT
ncbi:MAG: phosphotransferase, partial [Thiomargarita sp.]|nr:phosphotransferase [Thiomargarita sp.]